MTAYCGLDCESCDAYLATIHDDQALRKKTAALWTELNHVPILPEQVCCEGCLGQGVKTIFCDRLCEIRKCAVKKSLSSCGDCPEWKACPTVGAITARNPSAWENLKRRAEGLG